MRRPANANEYADLIDQAIYEVDELLACAEDEGEGDTEFTGMSPVLSQLDAALKALRAEVASGRYAPGGGEDLPFAALVASVRGRLPIVVLLDTINLTHKRGFEA